MNVHARVAAFALAFAGCAAAPGASQEIPRPDYLTYMPPGVPAPIAQTAASAALQLFGDTASPDYRDVAPRDGIDDRRGAWLHRLAVRFSPWLVRNAYGFPMDWRRFISESRSFPLFVDNFDVAGAHPDYLRTDMADLKEFGAAADSLLLALVDRYAPDAPWRPRAVQAESAGAQVLFFDWPGSDPSSWRSEYASYAQRHEPGRRYEGWGKTFVHPFIAEAAPAPESAERYELVLQYWFFYPENDGPNVHEGDWEHMNVVIAPLTLVQRALTAGEMRELLAGRVNEDSLVIRRVAWYFHQKVFVGDFARPNAYQSRAGWQLEVDRTAEEHEREDWIWERLRYYAWADDDETRVNTHPMGFIGGDPKGLDRIIQFPNPFGRESHGTYPFPGLFKDIGPEGAGEEIRQRWDLSRLVAEGNASRTAHVVRFDDPDGSKVEIIPDWERVLPLLRREPEARRDWAWMVLPIRWGYPATRSPLAGVIRYADTGNLAPLGPSFSGGWNRVGDAAGFETYAPHPLSGFFPLGIHDNIAPDAGFLNLTAPLLVTLPPFDLLYRAVVTPIRRLGNRNNPTFFTGAHVPFRVLGGVIGYSINDLPDEYARLFFSQQQSADIRAALNAIDTGTVHRGVSSSAARGVYAQADLYLGRQFASENLVRYARSDLAITEFAPAAGREIPVRGTLHFFEYAGSLRYNIRTEGFEPFLKVGYGLSWYQLRGITVDASPIAHPDAPWVRRPSLVPFRNIIPNTLHAGVGMEIVPVRSLGALPGDIDAGLRAEAVVYTNDLGLDRQNGRLLPTFDQRATRWQFNLSGTLSF